MSKPRKPSLATLRAQVRALERRKPKKAHAKSGWFAAYFRIWQSSVGLTLDQLARCLGMTVERVTCIQAGEDLPTTSEIVAIAVAIDWPEARLSARIASERLHRECAAA